MFGIDFDKLVVIGIIAVFLLGPEKLPDYAVKLARLVRKLRAMANDAKGRMHEEMGPEFDDVDWRKLDPRQYDPRRIIRDALLDDDPDVVHHAPVSTQARPLQEAQAFDPARVAPYDDEST